MPTPILLWSPLTSKVSQPYLHLQSDSYFLFPEVMALLTVILIDLPSLFLFQMSRSFLILSSC